MPKLIPPTERIVNPPIDIAALYADIQRRFPKTLEALRQSELADFDLEGLRVTEEICADRVARLYPDREVCPE